ncbi:MAG: trypsin-like peptidase domain-containing protein [Actinomycetota bacterium]
MTDIEGANDRPNYGASTQSPLGSLPSSPPTYDPATRLFAPLPDPTPQTVSERSDDDAWWANPWPLAAIGAAIALVVAASVIGAFLLFDDESAQGPVVSLGGGSGIVGGENLTLRGGALDVQGVLSVVSPSVVSIETNQETLRGVFGGAGSGIVIDSEGLILTNAHVIEDADDVTVVFFDGTRAPARIVSSIVADDVALVQAEGVTDTLPATLGTSEQLLVGDQVLAIGNALGLGGDPTVTLGILSAKNRQLDAGRLSFENLLQTDAAINPGNSGGPLVNAAGEVVGINTAIIEGSQNVGFAIAIESVDEFLEGFASGDASLTPDTAWFGASSRSINAVPEAQRLSAGATAEAGVFIIDVFDSSAADRAGLMPGDVITSIDGSPVATPEDVARIIRRLDPGDVIDIDYEREGDPESADVALGTRADASNGD